MGGPCGPPWASPPHWLLSCAIATALFLTQVNRHAKSRAELRRSISAGAAGRTDGLKFREVEVADRVQRLGGGAVLQVLRQSVQPGGILTLQRGQLGDSVAPTLGATAAIKGSPCPNWRCSRGPSSATARLALGVGNRCARPIADAERHGAIGAPRASGTPPVC